MKAVLFREHGGPVKLSYEDLPTPTIGSEDVLVRVKACALNHLDIWVTARQSGVSHAASSCFRIGCGRDRGASRCACRRRHCGAAGLCVAGDQLLDDANTVWPGETTCAARMACSGRWRMAAMRSM